MQETYNHSEIEAQVQQDWQQTQVYKTNEALSKEKFYCLAMFPYPSGYLHVGHVRNYTIADVIARYQRLKGKNVLQPIGWDAFGLPAENAAIKNKITPAAWTYQNIAHMRAQLKRLGFAYDWSREFATCDPNYYKWEQWLFTRLFKKGLAYRKNAVVNWDPVDRTVLANEQVIHGRGWRSNAPIERKVIPQWFIKITAYADELLSGLEQLGGWPEKVITMQRNWIGRSVGVEVDFVVDASNTLTVFTTRPDTLMGVSYLAIAPQHPLAQRAAKSNVMVKNFIAACKRIEVSEAAIATIEKRGINTGLTAKHPLNGAALPIWVANFVVMDYGNGAIMGVPAHDQRDWEFAQKYHLPRHIVLRSDMAWNYDKAAFTGYGAVINSGDFDGLDSQAACDAVAYMLASKNMGKRKVNYRLRDWGISRQRYWGTPIPIIYCNDCGAVTVAEKDLPVILPEKIEFSGTSSPLKNIPEFYQTSCPACGKPATRETDTFDTFMESSWYYARFASFDQNNHLLDDRAKYWTPVDQYIGGIEHAVMHLLYARFLHKVLRDEGLLNSDEPFARLLTQGMVLKDGSKMSKSKGNIIDPQLLIEQYGADTLRLFTIFNAPPAQSLEWSGNGVAGAHRFLKRLWHFCYQQQTVIRTINTNKRPYIEWKQKDATLQNLRRTMYQILQQANFDMQRLQLNTVVSASMKLLNLLHDVANYAQQHRSEADLQPALRLMNKILVVLLRLLYPITPHITVFLWKELQCEGNLDKMYWPKLANDVLSIDSVNIVIQVNGKVRGHINVAIDADKAVVKSAALQQTNVSKFIRNKIVRKVIYIPNKLINIVVDH